MARTLTRKQIAAGFGGKKRQAALRRGRSQSTTPRKRRTATRTRRTSNVARRKKSSRRSKQPMRLLQTIVGLNAVAQMTEPFIPAVMAGFKGDAAGALSGVRAGSKEALSAANLTQALTPLGVLAAVKAVQGITGFKSPSLPLGRGKIITVV